MTQDQLLALLLSRIQFGFTVSFHIIFPAFTIGLAAWLAVLEAMHLKTGLPVYRRLFDFWLRVFAVAFGLGVVSGIVMAFQFGSNWSELSRRTGPIQGPLLAYESFTAFALEASFFGVLIFGRARVKPALYLVSCIMVAVGTSLSSFWILVNNSWMQDPVGFEMTKDGIFQPNDWTAIIFSPVVWVRFPHMMLAAYVTTAFASRRPAPGISCAAPSRPRRGSCSTWDSSSPRFSSRRRSSSGTSTATTWCTSIPRRSPRSRAIGKDHTPAGEILFAWPDIAKEKNDFVVALPPPAGSIVDYMSLTAKVTGIKSIPKADRPPMLIPFFAFRIMVGIALLMLVLAWGGSWFAWQDKLEPKRWLLWPIFLSFPLGFIATLTGWLTAEVGRQPWTVFGKLRTADAVTPFLGSREVATSLAVFASIYALIFVFGAYYIYRLLKAGPAPADATSPQGSNPKRPFAVPAHEADNGATAPAE